MTDDKGLTKRLGTAWEQILCGLPDAHPGSTWEAQLCEMDEAVREIELRASTSLESARSEALAELRNYAECFAADDEGLHLVPEHWNRMRELIRALQSPARVAEEKDVHSTELRK